MRKMTCVALILVLVVAGACTEETDPTPTATPDEPPATETPEAGDPLDGEPEIVAGGLEVPWDLAFAGDDVIFVTERPGRVRAIRDGELLDEPVATLDVASGGEGGLLGVAASPDGAWLYLYYTSLEGENRVSRFPLNEDLSLGNEEVVLDGIPAAPNHNGGRLEFGPDGALYVTTGDAGEPQRSADPGSLAGKILRVDPDGGIPGDQPFDGSPVWAYGLRNPQGLTWDTSDRMYVADHGPTGEFGLCCRDELNLVEPGSFLGWPFRSGGAPTGAGEPPEDAVDPVADSGEGTWAPSGIAFYSVEGEGRILMANLRGQHLRSFTVSPSDPRAIESQETLLDDRGRLRHVAVGPDDCVYVLTSNRDGRGDPADQDDVILRFCA